MTYYAIRHSDGKVLAEADGYLACSEAAFEAEPWGGAPAGEVAPYYLTTMRPTECSICDGYGYHLDYGERWTCQSCDGSGYSFMGATKAGGGGPMTLRDQILRFLADRPADAAIPTAGDVWGLLGTARWYQVVDALGDAEADGLLVLQDCSAGMAVRLTEAGRKAAEEARP